MAGEGILDLHFVDVGGVVVVRADENEDNIGGIEVLHDLLLPFHARVDLAIAPYLDAAGVFKRAQLAAQFFEVLCVFAGVDGEDLVRLRHSAWVGRFLR